MRVQLKDVAHLLRDAGIAVPDKPPRGPNKTERRFLIELEKRVIDGELIGPPAFEAETLILSEEARCTYTPDWTARRGRDGTVCHFEVKGAHAWEDSIIKLKWSAKQYPEREFYLCRWDGKRHGWTIRKIPADATG